MVTIVRQRDKSGPHGPHQLLPLEQTNNFVSWTLVTLPSYHINLKVLFEGGSITRKCGMLILHSMVFSKSQKPRNAGTLWSSFVAVVRNTRLKYIKWIHQVKGCLKTPQFQNSLLCSPFESNFPTWSRKCKCNFLMISWEYYLAMQIFMQFSMLKLLTHLARNLNLGLIYLITTVIQDT